MIFADQSIHNILFQKVIHKEGESEINYIKIFQNSKALAISVGNSYSEDELMHNFLDSFQKYGKQFSWIEIHQAVLSREAKFLDQKSLSISALQIDYLNL